MQTIWKFQLQTTDHQTIPMPKGAIPLAVQTQGGEPCLWALVNDAAPILPRIFAVYGTGHQLPDKPGLYLGTYQLRSGSLVFHVFDQSAGEGLA